MIKTSTRSSTKTPMASKSRLPLPQKYSKKSVPTPGSCPKARPAPNFNKIHKDWQDKFETGRVSGKKPCTVPREFEVTRPGTRFTHNGDSDGESLPDFEADQLALETILNDHGVGQNRITGRATVATEKPSAGKMKRSRSAHSIGKRRVFGELACDPEQKQNGRRRSRSAKKALEFSKEFQKSAESEFQPDNQAMESILNETGISVTDNKDQGRFTYAGPAATAGPTQIRQSLYYVPQTDRMSMAKAMTAYQNLLLSKLDSKGAKLQTPTDESVNNVLDRYNHSQQMPKVVQSPFGRTVAAPIRNSIYKSYQIQSNLRSPHPNAPTDKEEMADVNSRTPKRVMTREAQGSSRRAPYSCKSSSKKNVKWADVLNDETSCDVPVAFKKEKVSKKSLFQPLSANDTFVDDYKENSVPGGGEARPEGRGHSDRRDHANGDDATTALQHYSGTAAGDESSQTAATESSPSSVAELAVLSMTHPASLCTSQASTAPRTRHPTQACSTGHGHTSAHLAPPPPSHAQLTTPGITRNQDFYKTFNHGSQDVKGLAKVPCVVPCGPVNPYPGTTAWTGYGDSAANTNRQQLQAIGEKVQLERKIEQKEMAMHTDETEDGQTPQQGETTATEHVTGTTDTQDRVSRFVGHVKRTRKRQSIAELNESISESHVHLQRLEGEITRLQYDGQEEIHQGSGTQETTNIIYHLEMIRKQQEQLVLLEQQLQEQLTGRGHSVTQGQNRTSSECDSLNGNNASKESVARSQGHLTSQGQSTVFSDTMVYSGFENNNVIVNPADIPVSVTSQYTHTDCDTTKQPSSEHRMAPNMGPWMSPIFTPQNQRVAAQSHRAPPSQIITEMSTVSVCGTTPTVRECGAELPCPIDLSHGSRSAVCDSPYQGETLDNLSMPQSPYRTAFCPTTPSIGNTNSAFTSVSGSPLGLGSPFRSLSLKASVMSSPARSSPLRMMRRDEESLLRKVSVRTNERYLEALLDDECALYAYRLQTLRSEEENRMDISNPVARVLSEGDDMHFVPIMEEGPHAISLRENSAFCCYAR
ncbi:uncharacterized protein LOC110459485 isoform X2 [Mizuhopecten yessoensis]|uniref:Uncharacterized protein n=1 Tax=Mizuhopecten yessoensis TaxID=6573 RepID=A0A210R3E1_MIZYE|nr:uncharacterized protein LOC110459485 isoform X2 [Mizuhopecten yessoensis]OWF55472.1 hypothetical protein KP79_PYT19522 [Mizuhopecten yessoensis]